MNLLLSGNEAIARGAFEAGVALGAGYPGTPSTEILEALSKFSSVYCEWSPNEKVALEVAVGASMAGARALATMKHVGLNVAADPLFSVAYMGANGGLVIVSADDPGMHSSQNEQDNRLIAAAARIALIEPSTPSECRTFTKRAFELSEKFDTPVLLRTTTRLSHGRALVATEEPTSQPQRLYKKDRTKNVVLPAHARALHRKVEEQRIPRLMEEAERWAEVIEGDDDVAFITAGVPFLYVREAFPNAAVLKLGMTHPLPERLIKEFAVGRDIVVVEELEPYLEKQIRALGIECRVRKWPRYGELSVATLRTAVAGDAARKSSTPPLPIRPPALCPGCSHRGTFHALNRMGAIVAGDIGCYTLGALPPLDAIDSCMNMGASIGMAHGFRKVTDETKPIISVIGDSTFFHSGITGLLDVVYNGGSSTVVVLDNRTTAMTGHQGHPGTGERLSGGTAANVDIEALVRAVGVTDVRRLDPYDLTGTWRTLREASTSDEPTVLIAEAGCVLKERISFGAPVQLDAAQCTDCHACTRVGCPAIEMRAGRLHVDPLLCIGCTHCQQVCADCNAGIDIPLLLELIADNRVEDAVDVLLRTNPLPAVSARVCPHPCDHSVNALGWPQAELRTKQYPHLLERFGNAAGTDISVRTIEQWLGDYALQHPILKPPVAKRAERVAIIGAGPAGLSAAWQLARQGWSVDVIDAADEPGGMLRYGIPAFRLPRNVLDGEIARLTSNGVRFIGNTRIGEDVSFEWLREDYDAVIVAVGDARARTLRIAGDEGAGDRVMSGLDLLRHFNAGESVDIGGKVAIVGGGNTAIDCARAAVRLGAEAVIVYRRTEDRMPAIAEEIEEAAREGVQFRFEQLPTALDAANGVISGIRISRTREIDGRVVVLDDCKTERYDSLILAVGEEADIGFLQSVGIEVTERVPTNAFGRTKANGVFACGDVAFGYGTVTQSIASGRKTAETVAQYLQSKQRKQ